MNDVCLIINLSESIPQLTIKESAEDLPFALSNRWVSSLTEAKDIAKSNTICAQCIFCDDYSDQLEEFLVWFRDHVGCIPSLQLIICDKPSIDLIINIFEFGLSHIESFVHWKESLHTLHQYGKSVITNNDSVEAKCLRIIQSILCSKHGDMEALELHLEEEANFHYLAAYFCAIALESEGKFDKSLAYFKKSEKLNPLFIPAQMGYCAALLLVGRVKESLSYLKQVDAKNPNNPMRKLIIANAFCELGDIDNATKYIKDAKEMGASHQRYIESQVHLLIAKGKVGEALKLFDGLGEVGPHLASKLNDIGVSLSQAGKGKSALILYKKAHRIVRNDLKYKVSLNAALACHRIKDFEKALKYLRRCELEFGSSFEKLEKIKKVVHTALSREIGKDG